MKRCILNIFRSIYYFFRFNFYVLKERSARFLRYYPGHYSSPVPAYKEIKRRESVIFNNKIKSIAGIELNHSGQYDFLKQSYHYLAEFDFPENAKPKYRYFYKNPMFSFADAFTLFAFLNEFSPNKYIEVGSGYSSSLVLDSRKKKKWNNLQLTFIEPYPARLNSLLKPGDKQFCTIIEEPIQTVSSEHYKSLERNDILFVDSSHVLRIDSDLTYILFTILPKLNSGVLIHFHDIFWPLEYPEAILNDGRLWNESYFLRAFMQYNSDFEILFFGSYLQEQYEIELIEKDPRFAGSTASSLWLRNR